MRVGNRHSLRFVITGVSWILWLALVWSLLSAITALVVGRVIRARDEREAPPRVELDDVSGYLLPVPDQAVPSQRNYLSEGQGRGPGAGEAPLTPSGPQSLP